MENHRENGIGNVKEHSGRKKINARCIFVAVLVILLVIAAVVVPVVLVSLNKENKTERKKFTLEDYLTNKYAPRSFSYKWMTGKNGFYYSGNDGSVLRYNATTNTSTVLMDNSTFIELETSSYTVSPGERYVLIPYDRRAIYRHSSIAKYKLYDLHTKELSDLQYENKTEFQYISWSPTVDGLVFVLENNVFYRDNLLGTDAVQVTTSGEPDVIFNGVPDWVYEEEILGQNYAIWWSPDGQYFLFATFNDSQIGLFDLTYYGDMTNQYVTNKKLLYPKAGTTNPTITLSIFNTITNTTATISPPSSLEENDHYFTTVTWRDNENVLITWLNRAQNVSVFSICSAADGTCYENLQFSSLSGWLDLKKSVVFTGSGDFYFLILPQKIGDSGTYRHIAMINSSHIDGPLTGNTRDVSFVTYGLYDVYSIKRYDDDRKEMYYIAYRTGDPTSRHLFKTTTESGPNFQKPVCVTCSISNDCDWLDANFPDEGQSYMLTCLGPGVPTYTLRSVDDDTVIVFEDNAEVAKEIQQLALPIEKYIQIPLDEKQSVNARLKVPYDFTDDGSKKYNILTDVYGGPDTQKVTKTFRLSWDEYLVSVHNWVILEVDGRGTAGRGDLWRHAIYRHLGTYEVDDIIIATQFMKQQKYIGANSAIWGWSYGGFVSSLALGRGTDAYKCGIAVAPVTDYRYYDTIYTERFMGQPLETDNKEAYDYCNVSSYAENFKKSRFLLVHGTGDDNVHFQNSIQLVRALTEANVYFRSQFYTDQQHSINGGNSRQHLWNTLDDFLLQCFSDTRTHFDDLNNQ